MPAGLLPKSLGSEHKPREETGRRRVAWSLQDLPCPPDHAALVMSHDSGNDVRPSPARPSRAWAAGRVGRWGSRTDQHSLRECARSGAAAAVHADTRMMFSIVLHTPAASSRDAAGSHMRRQDQVLHGIARCCEQRNHPGRGRARTCRCQARPARRPERDASSSGASSTTAPEPQWTRSERPV